MTTAKPDKLNDLLESAINNSAQAWVAQSQYFDSLIKRNMSSFTSLSEARLESMKTIGESQSFNQAFEANLAYENTMFQTLNQMHNENNLAWDKLLGELSTIYTTEHDDQQAPPG